MILKKSWKKMKLMNNTTLDPKDALVLIQKIGTKYSGFGASCAKIADHVLNGTPLSEQTIKTIKLVQPDFMP